MSTMTSIAPADKASITLDFIWLELTARCNLHCTHCYADSHPGLPLEAGMNHGLWEKVLSEAHGVGCRQVQFIGGEVVLIPYLVELISHAKHVGFTFIEVFSNATLLDDSLIEYFQENGVSVATSFYCHDATIHDQITNRPGSWRKTLSSIDRLTARGLDFRVGIIEMDANRPFVAETVTFLRDRGVSNVGVDRARAFGRAVALTARASNLSELCGRCGNGRVCVTGTGEVYPCIMSRTTPLGSVLMESLGQIISGQVLSDFRRELRVAKRKSKAGPNCTPDCWPHGGCAPHDLCRPDKKNSQMLDGITLEPLLTETDPCGPDNGCEPDYSPCSPECKCEPDDKCSPDTPGEKCWPKGNFCSPI